MKYIKFLSVIAIMCFTSQLFAQSAKTSVIDIKVSSQCSMCKTTIEKALAYEKGVVSSNLDVDTHTVRVTYKPNKTTPENIRKAISAVGYDADDVPANPKAYAKLTDCCKKPEDRKFDHSGHKH